MKQLSSKKVISLSRTLSVVHLRLPILMLLSAISLRSAAQTAPCPLTVQRPAPPKAIVDVSLNKTEIHIGEWPLITFRITNCGSFSFYISKAIREVEWHGGFQDIVTGPPNAKGVHRGAAADYGPDYHPDILKEVEESWILLGPGEFYGGTVPLNTIPKSTGRWTIIGRRNPPRVADEIKVKFRAALKFPVLLDAVDSKPIHLTVVK